MTGEIAPRAQGALASTPQRLGILPTLWFWNDWERQRLLLPLTLVTAIPLGPLLVVASIQLHANIWLLQGLMFVVYPILLMGLVERHIRKQLAMRAVTGVSEGGAGRPRGNGRMRWIGVGFAVVNLAVLMGVWTGSVWMAALIAGSGSLVWLVRRPVRGILGRLGRSGERAALGQGRVR